MSSITVYQQKQNILCRYAAWLGTAIVVCRFYHGTEFT